MVTTQTTPEALTLADAARRFGVARGRLYHLALKLRLDPVQTCGERKLFALADVERLLALIVETDVRRVISPRLQRRAVVPLAE